MLDYKWFGGRIPQKITNLLWRITCETMNHIIIINSRFEDLINSFKSFGKGVKEEVDVNLDREWNKELKILIKSTDVNDHKRFLKKILG